MAGYETIAKNTIFLYFRMLLSMGVSLYTSRVILDVLGVSDYGIYNVVGGVTLMFAFLNNSMGAATSRFITFELGRNDKEKLQRTFSAAMTVHVLLAAAIFVLAETIGLWFLERKLVIVPERMDAARWVYQLSILSSIISILQVPYNATIIAHERMKIYAYVEILNTVLKLIIVFLLVIGSFDKLILYAALAFFVSTGIALIYRGYCVRNFPESRYNLSWDKEVIRPMLNFSGWGAYVNMSFTAKTQGINILLNLFFGVIVNAAYGIAFQVQNVVLGFSQNFLAAINPQITKLYAKGEIERMQHLLTNASKFSFLLFFLVSFPLTAENHFIMQLWLKVVPEYAVLFCQLNLVSASISCMFTPFVFVIHATGKVSKVSLAVGSIHLSVVVISYLFLRMGFSPVTPLIVSIVMAPFSGLLYLWFLQAIVPEVSIPAFFARVFFPCCIVVLLSSIFPLYLGYSLDEGWKRFLLAGSTFFVSFCVSTYFIVLNSAQREKYLAIILRKLSVRQE